MPEPILELMTMVLEAPESVLQSLFGHLGFGNISILMLKVATIFIYFPTFQGRK